jgi:hypothetical protein
MALVVRRSRLCEAGEFGDDCTTEGEGEGGSSLTTFAVLGVGAHHAVNGEAAVITDQPTASSPLFSIACPML